MSKQYVPEFCCRARVCGIDSFSMLIFDDSAHVPNFECIRDVWWFSDWFRSSNSHFQVNYYPITKIPNLQNIIEIIFELIIYYYLLRFTKSIVAYTSCLVVVMFLSLTQTKNILNVSANV